MNLKEAVEKELRREPKQFHDALFLRFLREDYESGDWDSQRMDVVRKRYNLSPL